MNRFLYFLFAPKRLLYILLLSGCGCSDNNPTGEILRTAPAAGTVCLKGEPLEYHQITLFPKTGRPAVGISDEKGIFQLGTNAPGDGAVPGTYQVSITWVGPPNVNLEEGVMEFSSPPEPARKIDKKYFNKDTSGLQVTIPEQGDTALKIDLQ